MADLEKMLCPVSFYKVIFFLFWHFKLEIIKLYGNAQTKAKYLKKTSQILIDEYDSDIPSTIGALIKLPGVGPKMAHICMYTAWKTVSGIGKAFKIYRIMCWY